MLSMEVGGAGRNRTADKGSAHLTLDVIIPAMQKAGVEWRAFHAFRRGLAAVFARRGCAA